MRLALVQKALKKKGIEYQYREIEKCGDISFTISGKYYMISEFTGDTGVTPIGIFTNVGNWHRFSPPKQRDLVAYIEKNFGEVSKDE